MSLEPVKGSFGSQVVTAIVFTAIVSGIVLAAKLASNAPADDADESAGLAGEPVTGPPPSPLTPETARNARELHAALLARFGNNSRGQTFISHVDYDAYADRLHVSFPLDESDVTTPTARAAGLKRVRDVLEAIRGTKLHWSWVLVTGTAPARDGEGVLADTTVLRVQVARERLAVLQWDRFAGDDVPGIAEQLWFHPDLSKPPPADATSRPATRAVP